MDLGLEGRVALVTGGGRGAGKAVALALAGEGARVAVCARTQTQLDAVVEAGADLAVAADLTGEHAVVSTVRDALGPIEILVLAHASFYRPTKLHNLEESTLDALMDLDLHVATRLCRQVLPGMMQGAFGRIVALSSLAARMGIRGGTPYTVAKAGLEGLMRGVAIDYSRFGITANALALGFIDGERLAKRTAGHADARQVLAAKTATRRLTTEAQVADVTTFLCSARASAITGAVLDVTSGAHLNVSV